MAKQRFRINHQIRSREVVVIDETGENRGRMSRDDAIALAQEKGLALVEVNPAAKPPVAKIVDHGKFVYEQQKKERKARQHQKAQELKHVKIKFRTSEHDLQTKARQADKFLKKGNKVRLEIFLRGRERAFREMAQDRLKEFMEMISEEYRVIEEMKKVPSGFIVTISK